MVCDIQEEYIEHLFKILSERLCEYRFHLFHDPDRMTQFIQESGAEVLLIGEEYRERIRDSPEVKGIFLLTENKEFRAENGDIPIFRYQSARQIVSEIMAGIRVEPQDFWEDSIQISSRHFKENPQEKKEKERIHDGSPDRKLQKESCIRSGREKIKTRGLIGIYSPVHRIGKTRFAMNLGQKLSEKAPVLYLNMEGYSGGGYYFPDETGQDLGDLIYCMKQERPDHGLKISAMTGQSGGMDYIMPMKNETDLRSVKGAEWISLFDMILEKCIYEVLILDLGDCIDGLYDILRNCTKIYTPYIRESAAMAKLAQYETNLRTAGYGDILMRTVKREMQRRHREGERAEAGQ